MQVQFEKTGACSGKLSVVVPKDRVDEAWNTAYRTVAKSARIPGFRPGKAPRHVIEAHFGERLRSDVENELVRSTLPEALTSKEVAPVATPKVETKPVKKGDEFSYTAEIETQPEISLQNYKGLEVPKLVPEVATDEVDVELQKLREQSVQLVPVLDREIVEEGDLVQADYDATEGGMPLQGAVANNTIIETGGEDFIPGMTAGLVGASVPGRRDVAVDFPDDYAIEPWRGKKVTFHVELKELKKKELPEIDDEFAKDIGEESLEALTTKITESVEKRKNAELDDKRRKAVLTSLIGENPFDVPPSMIADQVDRMIMDAAQRVQQMMGPQFNLGQLDIEALRKDNREMAEFNVRSGLLLLEVAKDAEIEAGDGDIDAEIERIASDAGDEADRVKGQLNAPEQRDRIKYKLLEDKTIAFLLENSVEGAAPKEEND